MLRGCTQGRDLYNPWIADSSAIVYDAAGQFHVNPVETYNPGRVDRAYTIDKHICFSKHGPIITKRIELNVLASPLSRRRDHIVIPAQMFAYYRTDLSAATKYDHPHRVTVLGGSQS